MMSTMNSPNDARTSENWSRGQTSTPPDNQKGTPVPNWLPVSLLALTTAALAVPIVLLRRARSNALSKGIQNAPPRRTATTGNPPLGSRLNTKSFTSTTPPPRRQASSVLVRPEPTHLTPTQTLKAPFLPKVEDDFNGALYSAKAFGIATVLVSLGAVTTVCGIKIAMGVKDTQEFAQQIRRAIFSRMPALSTRIHRPPSIEDHGELTPENGTHAALSASPLLYIHDHSGDIEWSWSAAEARLRTAFERDGFSGWAQAALQELEAEGKAERIRRGHE